MKLSRPIAFTLWFALIGALATVALHADYTADMSVFLPRSPSAAQRLLVDQLKDGLVSRMILVGISDNDSDNGSGSDNGSVRLADVSRRLAAILRADARFDEINNGEATHLEVDRQLLFDYRYALSPAVDAARFSVDGLRTSLQATIALLASPAGLFAKPLVTRDPTGELLALLATLDHPGPRTVDGVWMSAGGDPANGEARTALLLALTAARGGDLDGQEAAMAAIRAAFATACETPGCATLKLEMSGPGIFAVNSRATIKSEVTRIAAIGTSLIVMLLLIVYRSAPVLLLGLVPVITGSLAGIAAVGLGFGVVHGLTLGFGTTLLGEAVDYAIYLFVQRGRGTDAPTGFWSTIRLAMMTSACGFLALFASNFPGLAQLGLYSLAGLITAALTTRYLLPAMLPPGFHIHDPVPLGLGLARLARLATRLRWLPPALALICLFIVVNRDEPMWQGELLALSPVPIADQMLDQRLRRDLGAPDTRYLIVLPGADIDAALTRAEALAPVLDRLQHEGRIGGWDSPARYLPSLATQRARLASLPSRAQLSQRLETATADLPIAAARLTPFLDEIERARARPPLTRAALAGTSIALAVDALLLDSGHEVHALLPLTAPGDTQTIDGEAVRAALAAWRASTAGAQAGEAIFVDLKNESDALYGAYLGEVIRLTGAGIVAIIVLLSIFLRRPMRVVRVVLPLATAILTVLAALSLAGMQLILLHLVGMLLIVAVGSNYALFFDGGEQGAAVAPHTYASLLFANLTTVAGYGPLIFSTVPVLQAIGITVAPGAILVLLFATMLARPQPASKP
ncbi:MAG: MMPL family transporter [Azoarcus sp.]|nr:MMPL family transporter [Azoarcus sp.]